MISRPVADARPVLRFAPSPNGPLHLGHALSALTTWDTAQQLGGRFLLRIEDIDTVRCLPRFIDQALDDLAWLGLVWEEPVLRQSEHFPVYRDAARRLRDLGLLYPCFATRAEIAAAATGAVDPDGAPLYPGLWRGADPAAVRDRLASGKVCAWRLDMAKAVAMTGQLAPLPLTWAALRDNGTVETIEARPERWGDAVIVRKDTPTSYHLSVVVDDARQGITHVTRGLDLLHATDLHRLLQVLLDLPEPVYAHHPLVLGPDGRKLSKSEGAPALAVLRAHGETPDGVRRRLRLPVTAR